MHDNSSWETPQESFCLLSESMFCWKLKMQKNKIKKRNKKKATSEKKSYDVFPITVFLFAVFKSKKVSTVKAAKLNYKYKFKYEA